MQLKGLPLDLNSYEAFETVTNRHFKEFGLSNLDRFFLHECMEPFTDQRPVGSKQFLVDDHRGAVSENPASTMDGIDYNLSVKGIGSTTNPFSHEVFGTDEISFLLKDAKLKEKVGGNADKSLRYITGELWLRGSPYGGQGLQHASTAMNVSEMADLNSIHGFHIAPLAKIVFLPTELENAIKKVYWYRRFRGRIVQEIRLVPSNIRIYFHSGSTVGGNIGAVFDLFRIDSDEKALAFLKNFVKSGVAYLSLFVRSIAANQDGTYSGLDFYDVWLDKDAVLAPDGTIYFVDLEGLEWITVGKDRIPEKIHDQIYRSLYEFLYAYEQVEQERARRFGSGADRRIQFEQLLREALVNDEVVDLEHDGTSLALVIGNILREKSLVEKFPIIDW